MKHLLFVALTAVALSFTVTPAFACGGHGDSAEGTASEEAHACSDDCACNKGEKKDSKEEKAEGTKSADPA